MRRAAGEILTVLGGFVGWGDPQAGDRPPLRRGPALLALQTVVVAVVVSAALLVRRWITGTEGSLGYGLAVVAVLCLLPMAGHWIAAPPRRTVGLLAWLATTGALLAAGVGVLGVEPVWTGLPVVCLPVVLGAAVFGWVSTLRPA